MKKVLKSNLATGVMILIVVFSISLIASDVTVKEGNITMDSGKTLTTDTIVAVDSNGISLQNDAPSTVLTINDDGTATLADSSQLDSSAAPTADADIANKKYVDDQVAVVAVGSWTNKDTDANNLAADVVYQAQCDGFFVARVDNEDHGQINMYAGINNPPVTIRTITAYEGSANRDFSVSCLVAKDDYVKVHSGVTIDYIFWRPIGTGGLEAQ